MEPNEPSPDPNRIRGGLLNAVLTNPLLRRQLGAMPADDKTIAISADGCDHLENTNWKIGELDSSEFETLEVPSGIQDLIQEPSDLGFIPHRHVATLGSSGGDDADYRVIGQLGSGGTGIVFQAHQRAVDREVAIKMLRDDLSQNQLSRNRFITEARVIGGLDHPNVIAVHEMCRDDCGGLFYSMKRIDGTSWDHQLAGKSLDENIDVLLRVADGIRYAHSRGLVHRDIKPENVMLGRFGEVLLADWGLAISHGSTESAEGVANAIGGTPAYMAPELASGDQDQISYTTDVYLLGATLFQILTGFAPHRGKSLLACIHAAAHNEFRETNVEGELMDIAMKAMASSPQDRYQTVDLFIEALSGHEQHAQSTGLVRRACERLAQATSDNHYEDFRVVDALLSEALAMWPDNHRGQLARVKMQSEFARAASVQGDLDLSLSLYEAAGMGDSQAAKDVRHRREHRDVVQHQASRYSALFTQSPEAGLLIQMSTGKVVEANEVFGDRFGYTAKEVVGRLISELNLWACPERRRALGEELRLTGGIENFEAQFLHTDGHVIDVLISGRVVDLDGEAMVVSTIRDISLRKQAENDLNQSRQRLHDLQALAGLATWSYDVQTEEVTWSEEAFRLVGRSPEQGVPTREEYLELIHPEDRGKLMAGIDAAVESGAAYEVHIKQKDARGQYKRVLVRGQPIFDAGGKTIEIYGVVIPERTAR